MDTSVINLIMDRATEVLLKVMRDDLESSDVTRAGLVRTGLLQDNPTKFGIAVLTYSNDPDNDGKWRHSIAEYDVSKQHNPPRQEIGGSEYWYRRFTTKFEMFWPKGLDRTSARQRAMVALSRAEFAIKRIDVDGLADTFNEQALQFLVDDSQISDAGGGSQQIHHATIWWKVMTGKVGPTSDEIV